MITKSLVGAGVETLGDRRCGDSWWSQMWRLLVIADVETLGDRRCGDSWWSQMWRLLVIVMLAGRLRC